MVYHKVKYYNTKAPLPVTKALCSSRRIDNPKNCDTATFIHFTRTGKAHTSSALLPARRNGGDWIINGKAAAAFVSTHPRKYPIQYSSEVVDGGAGECNNSLSMPIYHVQEKIFIAPKGCSLSLFYIRSGFLSFSTGFGETNNVERIFGRFMKKLNIPQ